MSLTKYEYDPEIRNYGSAWQKEMTFVWMNPDELLQEPQIPHHDPSGILRQENIFKGKYV